MKFAVWPIDIQRNIGSRFLEIRLYRRGDFFVAPLFAENLDTQVFRDSAQQVQCFYTHIVVDNNDRLFRHAVDFRVSDIGFQLLSIENQEMFVGCWVDEVLHDFLHIVRKLF